MVVLTLIVMATGFHFRTLGTQAVRFNHVMTQGKTQLRRQRMHNILHAFRLFFANHAAAIADKHG